MPMQFPEQLMQSLDVAGIYLFGSRATGTASAQSDYDFGVILNQPHVLDVIQEKTRLYNALYDFFSNQIQQLVNIDIVFLQRADLQIRTHVIQYGRLEYVAAAGTAQTMVGNFIEQTLLEAADFAPIQREFHQAILARI